MPHVGFVTQLLGLESVAGRVPDEYLDDIDVSDKVAVCNRIAAMDPLCANYTGSVPTGERVEVTLALIPRLGEQFASLARPQAVELVCQAVRLLAKEGCEVIGLGSLTGSGITGGGKLVAKRFSADELNPRFALTTGNTLAAVTAVKAVETLTGFADGAYAVVGATGGVGAAVSTLLAEQLSLCSTLCLIARNEDRLESLASDLDQVSLASVKASTREEGSLTGLDVIVVTTASSGILIGPDTPLKPGAMVIDETMPRNTAPCDGVLTVDGGLVETTIPVSSPLAAPPGTVYACFVETVLLGLTGVWDDFNLGRLDPSRMSEIEGLYTRYGFRLAPFHAFGEVIPDEKLDRFRWS